MKKLTICLTLLIFPVLSLAEPYLAVREGLDCSSCHVNPSGGGLRNNFGNLYAQTQLPVNALKPASSNGKTNSPWTGEVLDRFLVGGNARYSARQFDVDGQDNNTAFGIDRVSLYLDVRVNDTVSILVDQQVAPNGSLSRESWFKAQFDHWYVKGGKIFLPFGWRIEDDSALIREVSGINFNSADNGVEIGYQAPNWALQFAATNGTAGAIEVDDGKQLSLRAAHRQRNWQLGVSLNDNRTDFGEREMAGLFAGLNTGPISWLLEWDQIDDHDFVALNGKQDLALFEANYLIARGHNLKLSIENQQFDDNREDRRRLSLVWEYFPIPFTQIRVGLRSRDSDDITPSLNSDEAFVQAHVFF